MLTIQAEVFNPSAYIQSKSECGCSFPNLSRSYENKDDVTCDIKVKSVDFSKNTIVELLNNKMVLVQGGDFFVGTNNPILRADGEAPKRSVNISSFLIDIYEVSNVDFQSFINNTNYITESELFGWSFVFHSAISDENKKNITQAVLGAEWWLPVNKSYWRSPEGFDSDVFKTNRSNYPVVQVSWKDSFEFCKWRNARLPTEAEWEIAAKGKNINQKHEKETLYPWGNNFKTNKKYRANVFQGQFPTFNTAHDGYSFMAPVDSYIPQNDYGLYNMIGNVWEWVDDWWTIEHEDEDEDEHEQHSKSIRRNQINPKGPKKGTEKVKKGGSFLCHPNYCYRYRTIARFHSTPDSGSLNTGFRCAATL